MTRKVCSMTSPSGKNCWISIQKLTTRSTYVLVKFRWIAEGLDGQCGNENCVEGYRMLYILERTYKNRIDTSSRFYPPLALTASRQQTSRHGWKCTMQLMFLPARPSPFPRPSVIVSGALLILPFIAALLVRHPDQHPLEAESCLGDGLLRM